MSRLAALTLLASLPAAAPARTPTREAEALFELKVRPVLANTCFPCHGGKKVAGKLRVDGRAALLKGGKSGPAIVPGDPDRSLLIRALRHAHESIKMPPGKRLPDPTVADFASWVKQGAVWPESPGKVNPFVAQKHWAFQPIKAVDPPPDPTGWDRNPVDSFIAARRRAHGLKPVAPADRRALIRRVTYDLTGLPPAPEEVDAFVNDKRPDAFARVVDRLLASPAYGERWGRHWMDVVRYADTAGDNADYPIPEARLYRDYIIDSFNSDKPYDEFVREQLAGDLLARAGPPGRYAERVIATGFLALARRYATAPYELWHLSLEDAVATTGSAFLGLTLRCARCHDHKYDPVTQKDYYALYGFFAATTFPYAGSEELASKGFPRQHFAPLLPPTQAAPKLAAHSNNVEALKDKLQKAEAAKKDPGQLNRLREALRALERPGLPAGLPGAYAVSDGRPVEVRLHVKGDPAHLGPAVPRGVPKFLKGPRLPPLPEGGSGRLQLARWVTDPGNPLTARVIVNRVWHYHFGKGLVATPNNLGVRGEPPTHPELLDWLAATFVEGGWSIKKLHRTLLLSKTYQLAGAHDAGNAARDPGNRWYWRFDARRLEGEAIRDALLAVSGDLDRRRPGAHPFPPIASWGWTQHNPFKEVYPSDHRSVYLMTQRIQRHPFLALFDGPDANESTEKRTTSTVPLQALFLMNNPFMKARAGSLARRLLRASGDPARRVDLAHEWAYARPATGQEVAKGKAYVERYQEELKKVGVPADQVEVEAWTSYARVVLCANEFVYLD
jgi:hypothetical protein